MKDRYPSSSNTLIKWAAIVAPYTRAEAADFSAADYEFSEIPRALNCSAAGTLVVDMQDVGVQVSINVTAGCNPFRVTKIYNAGSDAIEVLGIS